MAEQTCSRQMLEETPGKVWQFLQGVGTHETIRQRMATLGYGPDDHQQGWSLLHRVAGYREESEVTAADARAVAEAMAELEACRTAGDLVATAPCP